MDGGGGYNFNGSFGAPYYRSADYQIRYPAYLRPVAPPPVIVNVQDVLHPRQYSVRKVKVVGCSGQTAVMEPRPVKRLAAGFGGNVDVEGNKVNAATKTKSTKSKKTCIKTNKRKSSRKNRIQPSTQAVAPSTAASVSRSNDACRVDCNSATPTTRVHSVVTTTKKSNGDRSRPSPPTTPPPNIVLSSVIDDVCSITIPNLPPIPPPPPPPPPLSVSQTKTRCDRLALDPLDQFRRTAKRFEQECRRRRQLATVQGGKDQARNIAEQAKLVVMARGSWKRDAGDKRKTMTYNNGAAENVVRPGRHNRTHNIHDTSQYAELERLGLGTYHEGGRWVPNSNTRLRDKLKFFQ